MRPTSRPGPPAGGELLCVAAVIARKGHDVLLDALATMTDLPWRCVCVGSLDRDPAFVDGAPSPRARTPGSSDRVRFAGPRTGRRSRPQLRRRRPAGAGIAGRDVRHGRDRGAGPRAAGRRGRGRRGARGARSRRRRHPARAAGAARRRDGARRRAAGVARRRRSARAPAPRRPRAARDARRLVDHHGGRSRACCRRRRDDAEDGRISSELARPARAGRRRGPRARPGRAPRRRTCRRRTAW